MNWNRLLRRRKLDADLDEELRAHLRMAVADRIERGEQPAQAERNARREIGNDLLVRETTRDTWAWAALERFAQDLRYALRRLGANRLFTCVAVLTLALGIGVNTAIFTLVQAVMYNKLPVERPAELYRLGKGDNCCVMSGYQNGQDFSLFSYELYRTLREGTPEIQNLAAFQAAPQPMSVRRTGAADAGNSLKTEYVSSNYFALFGIRPAKGQFFTADDESRGAAATLVLSERAWRRYYGADPSLVGTALLIKGHPFTVIGIAPESFYGETLRRDPPDCWLPAATEALVEGTNSLFIRPAKMWVYLMGRIPAGANLAALESKINVETKRWYFAQAGESPTQKTRHDIEGQFVPIVPAAGGVETLSMAYHNGLMLLMSLSSLVLLIACANVANLLLARVTALRAQNSLKLALGASRGRMMRQALMDSLLLSLLGCGAGLGLAFGATHLILLLAFRGARFVPIEAAPSLTVLGFAVAVSVATGLLFGAAPAWIEARSDPAAVLRGASRSVHGGAMLPQKLLVIAQAVLSFVLLTGAGLLTESLRNLEGQPFGFRTDSRLVVKLNPAFTGYTSERLVSTYRTLLDRLRRLPGVTGAAAAFYLPMTGNNWNDSIYMEGSSTPLRRSVSYDRVSPGYFDVIGTRVIQGRGIDETDQLAGGRTAVVSQAFAELCCAGRSPIGLRCGAGSEKSSSDYTIVGVVADAIYNNPYRPAYPTIFLPLLQPELNQGGALSSDDFAGGIVLRMGAAAAKVEPLARQAIAATDANLGVLEVRAYDEEMAQNFNKERLLAKLTQLFGVLALVLASIGLYGLVALSAGRRTAEIGLRMALGAGRRQVIVMILGGALMQVLVGIAIGLPASLAGTRYIQHELFGVSPWNPLALAGAAVLLVGCAVAAAIIPAAGAARLDPMRALRVE